MAAKIEVGVAVDDGAFAAFARKFKDYQSALDKTPDAWKKVSRSSEESALHFEMMTAALTQQSADMAKIATHMGGFRRDAEKTASHWQGLARSTMQVASNIKETTTALLKWSGITGLIAGIAGGAGFSAFDALGYGVASNRTSAMGMGATYGGRSSFLTNFDRLGDAGGLLGRVNDVSHRADNIPLRALGLSQEESQGETGDVAANALIRLKKLVGTKGDGYDERFLQDKLHANRSDELVSLQQAQVLRSMSPQEVADMVKSYRENKGKLGLSDGAQKKWQDFATQMSRAGAQIENTFVKRLGALTPGLTDLSKSFSHMVDILMRENGPLAHWIDSFAIGIEDFAKKVDTPEFQENVRSFMRGVETVARLTGKFVDFVISAGQMMGLLPDAGAQAIGPSAMTPQEKANPGKYGIVPDSHAAPAAAGPGTSGAWGNDDTPEAAAKRWAARGGDAGSSGSGGGFMDALARIESSNRNIPSETDPDYPGQPGSKSQGYFQIDTPTWRSFAGQAGVDTGKYPNAMSAPREVQERVASLIPLARFGPRTRRMMQQQYGELDTSQSTGSLGARFAPTPNTSTKIVITKPSGSDANLSAAAAASPN